VVSLPWVNLIGNAYYKPNNTLDYDAPVGSFWWKDYLSLWNIFCNLASVTPGDGSTIKLWKDKWAGDSSKISFQSFTPPKTKILQSNGHVLQILPMNFMIIFICHYQ
jgi:hypothetical protein